MQSPNIILVHGHDLGRFLPCHGKKDVDSPYLEAFAESSVVFDQAYATAPLCTPARSSLFTGMSPHANGLMGLSHSGWRYRHSVRTLPELLEPLGYDTALVGLQHEHPDPTVLGFGEVHGVGFLPRALPVADEAVAWLDSRASRQEQRPFFLSVGMWEAHRPWPAEDYTFADPAAIDVPDFLPDNEHTREDLAGFYGAIRQLDAAVGRVMQGIDDLGYSDDTLVVFTTDHGAAFPRAKGTLYDPGVGVSLIIRAPESWNVPAGHHDGMVSHLDLLPTFLEVAGGNAGPEHEGRSLLGALTGTSSSAERALFFEKTYHDGYDPMRAVRTDRFKLIHNYVDGPALKLSKDIEESPTRRGMGDAHLAPRPHAELYDLVADPAERHDVAGDVEYRHVREELAGLLEGWMKRTRDPLCDDEPISSPAARTRLLDAQPDLV